MNEPIISPWFFYLVNIVDGLVDVSAMGVIISVLVAAASGVELFESYPCFSKETCKRVFRWASALLVTFSLLLIFIPRKDTCYQMLVASAITPKVLLQVGESAETVASKAMEIILKGASTIIQEVKK